MYLWLTTLTGVQYGGGKHAIFVTDPKTFGKVPPASFPYNEHKLNLPIALDRPCTSDPLQPRDRPCEGVHSPPIQTDLPQPSSAHRPLDGRRLHILLLHRPIFRAPNPVSTHPGSLGSHRCRSSLHPCKHHIHCDRHFQRPGRYCGVMHPHADIVAAPGIEAEEGAVDQHVYAWWLVSLRRDGPYLYMPLSLGPRH